MGKIKQVREIYKLEKVSYHTGIALGDKIATGKARYSIAQEGNQLLEGGILLPI
jgi:hypothetical protein